MSRFLSFTLPIAMACGLFGCAESEQALGDEEPARRSDGSDSDGSDLDGSDSDGSDSDGSDSDGSDSDGSDSDGSDSDDAGSAAAPDAGTRGPLTCSDTPAGAEPLPTSTGPLEVELGVRDAATGAGFLSLDDACSLPIGGIGQAGLTARLGLRVRGGPEPMTRAYARVVLQNYAAEPPREPAQNNGPGVVRGWNCREDGWCYLVPLLVEVSHLNRLPELEGTVVTFSAEVTDSEDSSLTGTTYGWGAFVLEEELE